MRTIPVVVSFITAVVVPSATSKPPAPDEAQVAHLAKATWSAPNVPGLPSGPLAAAISVDPSSGASVAYAKVPAGYVFPAHWHSHTEYTLMINGKATFTMAGQSHELVAGSYVVVPAKTQHQLTCAAGSECLVLTRRAGPTDYHFVDKR
jgi:quercetin dioxygenase-like cupin family protein